MKKKFNIIEFSGISGLALFLFVATCLLAGFLVFPGWVCMQIWNYVASYFVQMPAMVLIHGVMLWGIIALSAYALNKGNFSISFGSASPSEERIKKIIAEETGLLEEKTVKSEEKEKAVK